MTASTDPGLQASLLGGSDIDPPASEITVWAIGDKDDTYRAVPGTGMALSMAISDVGSDAALGGGFLRFAEDGAVENWKLTYDELIYVLHGELTIESGETVVVARPGSACLMRAGTTATYRGLAGTHALFVIYPANPSGLGRRE